MRVVSLVLLVPLLLSPVAAEESARRFPFESQADDFCGEACLAMALRHWGIEADQYRVHSLTGLSPESGRGAWTREMNLAARAIWGDGFPSPWFETRGKSEDLESRFAQLTEWVRAGIPCMVCCRYSAGTDAPEHFRLVTAIAGDGTLTYQEPAEPDGAGRTMSKAEFLRLWPVKGAEGHLLIVFPFSRPPEAARGLLAGTPDLTGRVTQLVRRLRKGLPAGFRLGVEGPFVIVSDQDDNGFKASRERTIRWAYTRLQKQFFPGGLSRPIAVYLFDGNDSYRKHCKEWFNENPHTPYGYYSSRHRALIMNIATGGGTLVHEMVHPLMEEHFSRVPSWFNEGLASLFEQCGEVDGRMVGLINWRHRGLLQAIASGQFESLERLMKTTSGQFYGNDQGDNYGIARYLCQYLQSKGKIEEYYRKFRADFETDPTGIASLKAVLGEESLEKIQTDWLAWVKALR